MIETYKILTKKEKVNRNVFFKLRTRNFHNTRGHSYKLESTKSRLELRPNFFSQRFTSHWNKLSEEVVQAETVNTFKNRLDNEWGAWHKEFSDRLNFTKNFLFFMSVISHSHIVNHLNSLIQCRTISVV